MQTPGTPTIIPAVFDTQDSVEPRLRIGKLDALRGIASLMVVVGHVLLAIGIGRGWGWVSPWPLIILWDGQAAVFLFFFLSGYVLAIPYLAGNPPSFRQFLIRRFFRIWPAYAVMLFVSLAVYASLGGPFYPPAGNFLLVSEFAPDFPSLLRNLFVMGSPFAINPPSWTLFVEMRVALVFPLLVALVVARQPPFPVKFLALLAAGYLLSRMERADYGLGSLGAAVGSTARWVHLFFLGAAVRYYQPRLEALFSRMAYASVLLLSALAVGLILYSHAPTKLPFQNVVPQFGVLIIFSLIVVSASADRLLARRWLLTLGALSYSIYLVHWPILFAAISLFPSRAPAWSLVVLVPALSVAFAHVLHRLIELPGMRIGRWASGGRGVRSPDLAGTPSTSR